MFAVFGHYILASFVLQQWETDNTLTVAKVWKQPKCPSSDEWIKKTWNIYTQWNITQPLKRMKF